MRSQGIDVPLELDPKSRSCSNETLEEAAVEDDECPGEGSFEEGEESELEVDPEVLVSGHLFQQTISILYHRNRF